MTSGLYWHCHHDVLLELAYDYEERVKYITEQKPADERELRLRLFQPVHGVLPEIDKARADYDKADADYDKADADLNKARADYDKARADLNKARADHKHEIEELHKQECPDCPWDGYTIFTKVHGDKQ